MDRGKDACGNIGVIGDAATDQFMDRTRTSVSASAYDAYAQW